jgi:hypothetical protein
VGIFIGEKTLWNKGYGTEAMRLLLRHGFETLNLNRICLRVFETNPRAVRSYEKAGFMLEGRERQGMYKDGQYIDVLMMSILLRMDRTGARGEHAEPLRLKPSAATSVMAGRTTRRCWKDGLARRCRGRARRRCWPDGFTPAAGQTILMSRRGSFNL